MLNLGNWIGNRMSLPGRIVVVQILLGLVCTAVFFAIDLHAGQSAALAMLTSCLPSAYYAWAQARILNATRLLMHGVLKTLLTGILMAVCIITVVIEPIGFFVSFAVMQFSYLSR